MPKPKEFSEALGLRQQQSDITPDTVEAEPELKISGPHNLPATVLRTGQLQINRDMPLSECPTNLDLKTRHGKASALAAMSPGTLEFTPEGTMRITATHWICFPDDGVDPETGEISEFTRTVFFDAAGNTYRTSSAHAPKRLSAILQLFGPDEWAAGLPLEIVERKSRKTGRTYHDIRVLVN
jgi:hypothetical protein